ncbi:hypothetical protein CAEBREN_02165 [Caenorhabditis brenneri]|uniref:Uncharacterized protein n=1 Tax=Caenorhabditis brenneri TaxID=135651 RepID=G0MAM1_CAEBE|nr:hypothetical protein CAEBREN_02165 [Caenorhabditis brenneri]
MVQQTNCPSPLVAQCTVETSEVEKCPNCTYHLLTIQKLKSQLAAEKLQKDDLAECRNSPFASLTREIDNNDVRDAKIVQLTVQLEETTAQLHAVSVKESAKSLDRTMDDFQREIMANKKALRTEIEKVNEVESEQIIKDISDQETAKSMIFHLETELQLALDRLKPIYDDTTLKDITGTRDDSKNSSSLDVDASLSSTSAQPPVNDITQPLMENLNGKV